MIWTVLGSASLLGAPGGLSEGSGRTLIAVSVITAVPALVAAVAATIGVIRARGIAGHAAAINDAVNHRHPTEPRLLDLVRDTNGRLKDLEGGLASHLGWHAAKQFLTSDEVERRIDDYLDDQGV